MTIQELCGKPVSDLSELERKRLAQELLAATGPDAVRIGNVDLIWGGLPDDRDPEKILQDLEAMRRPRSFDGRADG